MNPPDRNHSHHSNGQAESHALYRPQPVEEPNGQGTLHASPAARIVAESDPRAFVRPQPPESAAAPTSLAFAFHTAQENLAALQRLAEQTADLHRQFLEGQEKTQQTFLKLLEHQQRLSHSSPDPAALPPSGPIAPGDSRVPGVLEPLDHPAESRDFVPPRELNRSPARAEPHPPNTTNGGLDITAVVTPDARTMEASSHARPGEVALRPQTAPIGSVLTALVAVVAEKTGYPAEVLDLDMQLDADLGIDSIKRVEIFSALQERHPELPAMSPDQLGAFRTLRAITEFLDQARALLPSPMLADPAPQAPPAGREPRGIRSLPDLAGGGGGEDRVSRRDARARHAARRRPGDRLDQAGRDLLRPPGPDSHDDTRGSRTHRDPRDPQRYRPFPGRIGRLGRSRPEDRGRRNQAHRMPARAEPRTPVAARPDDESTVTRVLLEAVAEKTGYPVEMLELDMRLDADLGIDSIKRVEIFSAVQERLPETTAIGPDQTGTLQTLRQIVEFLSGGPGPDPTPPPSPVRPRPSENGHSGATAGRNGKAHEAGSHLLRAEPSRNGHGHSHGHTDVVLRRLEPRAVPLAASTRRESVQLPAGGTIWITDDGSALTEALRRLLVDRGYRVDVFATGRVDPPAPDATLCGLIVLASSDRPDGDFGHGCVPDDPGGRAGPATFGAARGSLALDGLAARWNLRFGRHRTPDQPRHRAPWPGSPRRPAGSGRRSIARPSTSTQPWNRPNSRPPGLSMS